MKTGKMQEGNDLIELIRVSTKAQAGDDRASIPAQRAINRRTAKAHSLEITETIEMTDVSGAAVLQASEMHRLIQLLRTGRFRGVVAREFSRLMRPENFYDMGLLQEFVNAGAMLYLPEGPIDFSNKTGRLMGTIRAAIAGLERTEILERSASAKEEMRRAGKCPTGYITWPYGVAYNDSQGWHYTADAEKVRKAFQLFTSGQVNYTALSRETGLTRTALACVLTNPIYTGWRVYDKRRDPSPEARLLAANGRQGDRRKIRRGDEDIIRVRVIEAQLVPDTMFETAQRIIAAKKKRHWRSRTDGESRFTYSGFLICAECQSNVYHQSGRGVKNRSTGELADYDYYVCRQRRANPHNCRTSYMGRERLEAKLDDLFSQRLTDRSYIRNLTQELARRAKDSHSKDTVIRIQRTISSLRERRERVIESVIDGLISREDGKIRTAAIDRDLQAADDALSKESPGPRDMTAHKLAALLEPLFDWKFLGRDHKRMYLATAIPEIHVADFKIHGIGVLPNSSVNLVQPGADVQAAASLCDYGSHRRTVYWWMRHTGTARPPFFR